MNIIRMYFSMVYHGKLQVHGEITREWNSALNRSVWLHRYSTYLPELDHINIEEHLSFGDVGDVAVNPHNVPLTVDIIEEFTEKLWNSGKFLVGIGGDHSVSYPIVKALTNTGKKVGIIHLDSHYDNYEDYGGDKYARSTPFKRLYETE